MEIEYVDEEVVQRNNNILRVHEIADGEIDPRTRYVTNTKDYDATKFDIISPEEVTEANTQEEIKNPNPEFSQAIEILEKTANRKLSQEEYFKAANAYATILVERDEEKRKNYEGKYEINPIRKEQYLKLILNNVPITNAFAESMKTYENSMIAPVMAALADAQKNDAEILELKKKARINLHYKGKCRIAVDEGGKVIVIDNKNDVDLLRMKYRKEWIEKKFPNSFKNPELNTIQDDEFE